MLAELGTGEFARVRVGVGGKPEGGDMVAHVLEAMDEGEWKTLQRAVARAADAVVAIVGTGMDRAMNEFNAETQGPGTPVREAGEDIE